MSQTSSRLSLPLIQPAQAQKHVTHNEAIELLDMIVQLRLEDIDTNAPPPAPQEGQTWGVGDTPSGPWAGQAGQLASFRGGGWLFVAPQTGWQAYVTATDTISVYTGANWGSSGVNGTVDFDNLSGVGINTLSDTTNRLSVSADATLLNNAGTGHQLKINKATTSDTASLLYQSGFSGRAEMGLAGTDDFAIKVSDGTTWFTGLTVQGASGTVQINEILALPPRTTPAGAQAGDIYFDSTTSKLRCFDGAVWQDLF